ncbi:hypothetical protein F2Q70_00026146 [Brassica cretica]|uniref:Uncharacterized protein n=1 Tax=Brassica cretica TaxID=69181 RepID=A0A8S9LHF5_BRACR|nr:hypothetical protein F2Q70_00026146 [Brassica cretica]
MTSTSTDDKTSTSIDRSIQKSTDVSSCVLVPDVDWEITMGDLLELKDEAQPENLDHNLEKKLDDYQHASEKDLETSQEASIDRYPPDCIDQHPPESIELHPPESIDRHPLLDELHGFIVEMEPIEETVHESEASRNDNYKHLRPLTCAEEAAGLHKRVKRVHDPVKIVVPCAVGAVIPDVAEMNDFDLSREWYDWVGQDPFQSLPHQDPRNHIEELEDPVSRSEQNEVSKTTCSAKSSPILDGSVN